MTQYCEIRSELFQLNDRRFCGPAALAVVADLSGAKARSILESFGRKRRCGTSRDQMFQALEFLKIKYRRLTKLSSCKTVRALGKQPLGKRTMLVFTATHVLAVKDGTIMDWTDGRLHRIKDIYLLEK